MPGRPLSRESGAELRPVAAKAALESYIRQLVLELAPAGTTANAILAA